MTAPYGSSPNPLKLMRDPANGWLAGVCAGIAEYFGLNVGLVRFLAAVSLVLFSWLTLIGYLVLAFALPRKTYSRPLSRDEAAFWRDVAIQPRHSLSGLRQRFAGMEKRVIDLEARITSPDWDLRRRFRDL